MGGYGGDVRDISEKREFAVQDKGGIGRRIEEAKVFESRQVSEAGELSKAELATIRQFKREFSNLGGADHVILEAERGTSKDRIGALHQMEVALELDGQVACFEEPIHPIEDGLPAAKANRVDIVTNDGYAIECKATAKETTYPSQLKQDAFEQAITRLAPNEEAKQYKGVVVVFENGKLQGNMRLLADQLEKGQPRLRFCEKAQVTQTLDKMRKGKA